jgi:hypothetical protein
MRMRQAVERRFTFGRLVAIMIKLMLASIPAVLIMYALMAVVAALVVLLFGGGSALLQSLQK